MPSPDMNNLQTHDAVDEQYPALVHMVFNHPNSLDFVHPPYHL